MSAEHFGRACKMTGLTTAEKCVLLLLANHADPDTSEAFPGRKKLAERSGLHVDTVTRVMQSLEAKGLIKMTNRYRENGSQTSHLIFVFPDLATSDREGGDIGSGGGRPDIAPINTTIKTNLKEGKIKKNTKETRENALDDIFGMTDFENDVNAEKEPSGEVDDSADNGSDPEKTNLPAAIVAEEDCPSEFDVFWKAYPRKISPGKVSGDKGALAKAMKIADFDIILSGLEESKVLWNIRKEIKKLDPKYFAPDIPHPTTWLNQGRWADDTETEIENAQRDYDRISRSSNPSNRLASMVRGGLLAIARLEEGREGGRRSA